MPCRRHNLICLGLLLSAGPGPTNLPACNVPVFRYALERWTPDPYVLVVFHGRDFLSDQQSALKLIQTAGETGSANLLLRQIEVSTQMPAPFRALWTAQENPALPWMVVRYPAQTGIKPSVWAGPLATEMVTNLIDSPARQEIARRLIAGDSAVWLLLASGNPARDDALTNLLSIESKKLQQSLGLPELGPEDPPLATDLPLRITFSTLRISRQDPAESMLVKQLLSWHPSLDRETRPMLFPVFGRARVLPPAIGEGINAEVIGTMARLLTGPCSCQIKEMNAGFDLLMSVDWGKAFQGHSVKASEGPPLVGLSQFARATTNHLETPPSVVLAPAFVPVSEARARIPGDHLLRNLAVVIAIAALFLGVTTVFLRAKPARAAD